MSSIWRFTYLYRSKFMYLNNVFNLCILLILLILFVNEKFHLTIHNLNRKNDRPEMIINHIQDIPILDRYFLFNITHEITVDNIPNWINRYKISHLFDFYWLQTGGYKWHLQQMINLKYLPMSKQVYTHNQTSILNYLHHHPEFGVIIDTAPDPFRQIFPPIPKTSDSLNETCIRLEISDHWYPCFTRSEMISSPIFQPVFTYGLYDIFINSSFSSRKNMYYDEMIYLFDNEYEIMNETFFVTQILSRLIRLLALVPQTAVVLSPYFNSKLKYVNQYMDILIQRGILADRKRLIKYHSEKNYHAHVVYSTSSPRSDLILLQHILIGNETFIRPELILIIRNHLDNDTYNDIVQTINQFQLSSAYDYIHIHEYHENSYSIKQISHFFRQALIVIGMPSHILSHIVWCLPGTHIIEIGQKNMTTDYYDISLQLKFHYWLAVTMEKTNQIDIIDFRNLLMKLFTYIDV